MKQDLKYKILRKILSAIEVPHSIATSRFFFDYFDISFKKHIELELSAIPLSSSTEALNVSASDFSIREILNGTKFLPTSRDWISIKFS